MLIFLDIDGVMVPAKGWKSPELLKDGFPAFSTKATTALRRLIGKDCTVYLTTSHKSRYSIQEWKQIFLARGIAIDHLDSLPPNNRSLSRKEELLDWFIDKDIREDFIIIDDDRSLNDLPAFLKAHLIQTSPHIGLTEEHVVSIHKSALLISSQ